MVPIYSGKMLKTFYNVNVWHKHDAWNEYGQGHAVRLPIVINLSPMAPVTTMPMIPQQISS